jgi:hypothetical protein
MGEWKKSGCVLCAQNCGLEMMVEDNQIVKVRGDKENPRSQGYCCRKGLNIASYIHNADRLQYPLRNLNGHYLPCKNQSAAVFSLFSTLLSIRLWIKVNIPGPGSISKIWSLISSALHHLTLLYSVVFPASADKTHCHSIHSGKWNSM